MAPKRIHMRRFLDPSPPEVVENPKRILRRSSIKDDKGIFIYKSLCLYQLRVLRVLKLLSLIR